MYLLIFFRDKSVLKVRKTGLFSPSGFWIEEGLNLGRDIRLYGVNSLNEIRSNRETD